jgi:prevent-host-death family protein
MKSWQLQEAKSRMSELVRSAQDEPQQITLHGRPVAVVISSDRFDALSARGESLLDFIRRSPLNGADDLVFAREQGLTRDVDL